jgi:2-amino-4-hydroxy-6-hydroxymethyldihydropteridine diphosphokinase
MKRHNISGQSFTDGGMDICLGLGSNIGNPEGNLLKALNLIKSPARQSPLSGAIISGISPVYLSSPVGNANQPYFLNCAVLLRLSATPSPAFAGRLLFALKDIEKNMGRKNESERYMPRVIDIDMLFIYDNASKDFITMDLPELKLPHPEIFNRRFVLYPVLDLPSYGFKKPFDKESIKKALAKLENSDAGAFQIISYYGKFDENLVQILR